MALTPTTSILSSTTSLHILISKLSLSNLFTYSSIFRSYLHIILQHSKVILLISNYISSLYLSITVMDLTINYLTKTGLPDNQLMSRI